MIMLGSLGSQDCGSERGCAFLKRGLAPLMRLAASHLNTHCYVMHALSASCDMQVEQPGTSRRVRVWFENPRIARPLKDDAAGAADKRLFPRDCREAVCGCPNHIQRPIFSGWNLQVLVRLVISSFLCQLVTQHL